VGDRVAQRPNPDWGSKREADDEGEHCER
jgi:hypothetical protein